MIWQVKLVGDNTPLEELSTSFKQEKLKIYKDGGSYILSSTDFNGITKAETVLEKSEKILNSINGVSRIIEGLSKPIQVDGIDSIDDNGKRNTYIFPKTAHLTSRTYRPTILINDKIYGKPVFEELPNWVELAKSDINVINVLKFLNIGSNDRANLYKIYEIIEKDVGGKEVIIDKKWASEKKIRLFKQTANSSDAIGTEARHGVQKDSPPKNPMSLNESKSFIFQLVRFWLNSKQ